jgi:hypothetical protein
MRHDPPSHRRLHGINPRTQSNIGIAHRLLFRIAVHEVVPFTG